MWGQRRVPGEGEGKRRPRAPAEAVLLLPAPLRLPVSESRAAWPPVRAAVLCPGAYPGRGRNFCIGVEPPTVRSRWSLGPAQFPEL
jgi:hypothetical protein